MLLDRRTLYGVVLPGAHGLSRGRRSVEGSGDAYRKPEGSMRSLRAMETVMGDWNAVRY